MVLVGCQSTPIKEVKIQQAIEIPEGKASKPVMFKKIVVKLRRGEEYGSLQGGLLCIPHGKLKWKSGKVVWSGDDLTEVFQDELRSANYTVVGDPNALFEDRSATGAELLIAGKVSDLKANICYPMAGFGNFSSSTGSAFMSVDWQVYSTLHRKVIYETTTEGSAVHKEATEGVGAELILDSFGLATQNLLADKGFNQVVLTEAIKNPTKPIGDIIQLTSSAPTITPGVGMLQISQQASATVRSGLGHGSGFFISKDGYLLTNAHVVGDAKVVNVLLYDGSEVVATVVKKDAVRDVALLKAPSTLGVYFQINGEVSPIGSEVYAIGTPMSERNSHSVTKGIISSYRNHDGLNFIQSYVEVHPGNSGGALIDTSGHVVGIAAKGMVASAGGMASGIGLNFFIPIRDAVKRLNIQGL